MSPASATSGVKRSSQLVAGPLSNIAPRRRDALKVFRTTGLNWRPVDVLAAIADGILDPIEWAKQYILKL
ncbi:uncharacterized protein Z520_12374 [Fonsecaea multimorphosa CBS 102226]|uniref:Uncharacterized protein n=1 Tax=Fonsecaea multimorphosa CBS 102226 TaxID=1442371 RepID=A0A0D2I3Q7_9EURO|nr:uncharacterized protein Z520_12374 [Fonsecaea multimorphosa CBS 102226]KIX91911.1 hypothetical protein Z520_12374 [Fonsecaea multimorphosa CBS 102226]